jgi:hypothetical protein
MANKIESGEGLCFRIAVIATNAMARIFFFFIY